MSNSLIPHLLSDSPPPIVNNIDEDDDDEFGDFTGPGDLSLNNSSSTPSTPIHSNHALVDPIQELNLSKENLGKPFEIETKNDSDNYIKPPTGNYINILDQIENSISKLNVDDIENEDILEIEVIKGVEEENESNLRTCDMKPLDEISETIDSNDNNENDLFVSKSDVVSEASLEFQNKDCERSCRENLGESESVVDENPSSSICFKSEDIPVYTGDSFDTKYHYSSNVENNFQDPNCEFTSFKSDEIYFHTEDTSEFKDEPHFDVEKNSEGPNFEFSHFKSEDIPVYTQKAFEFEDGCMLDVERKNFENLNGLQNDQGVFEDHSFSSQNLKHEMNDYGKIKSLDDEIYEKPEECGEEDDKKRVDHAGPVLVTEESRSKVSELEGEIFNDDDDDFGDFANFNSNSECNDVNSSINNLEDDFSDFNNFQDFKDFHTTSELEDRGKNDEEDKGFDDEFDDFTNYSDFNSQKTDGDTCGSSQSSDVIIKVCRNSEEALDQANSIFKKMFIISESEVENYVNNDFIINNSVFDNLKDITETNALMYQWGKSTAQKNILKTLNIDIRNILYGPSWNSRVPLFAANLSSAPLEPVKSDMPSPLMPQKVVPTQDPKISVPSDVPAVEFDWNGAGLTNPLDSLETDNKKMESTESANPASHEDLTSMVHSTSIDISSTLSDNQINISFVDPVNLTEYKADNTEVTRTALSNQDDFSDFTSYTHKYEIETNWGKNMLPLRESHISHEITDQETKNSPLKLTTNVCDLNFDWSQLESKADSSEVREDKVNFEDDFKVFESSMVKDDLGKSEVEKGDNLEPNLTNEDTFTKLDSTDENQQGSKSEEDEFTDFHSSLPQQKSFPEPLQPSVLQPVPANSQTLAKIEWPEPGLDEEEIDRIVSGCLRTNSGSKKEEEKQTKVAEPAVKTDDDEWTDFVSVKEVAKSRTSTDLPLSVFNLGSVKPNKPPTPLVTPNGLVSSPVKSIPINKSVPKPSALPRNTQNLKQPFITSQVFDVLHQTSMLSNGDVNTFAGFAKQSTNFPNLVQSSADDDEWGDFVSANNATSSNSDQISVGSTNIISNPSHSFEVFNKKGSLQQYSNARGTVVRQERRNIPSISAMPDLDFVTPKSKNARK